MDIEGEIMGDRDGWRRVGAGICLVGGPLFVLLGVIAQAGLRAGPFEDALEDVKSGSDRWWTGTVLMFVGLTLLIGAVLAIVHICRRGGADGFGLIGGTITIIGMASVLAIQALENLLWLMAQPGQDAEAMQLLARSVDDSNRMGLLYLTSFGFFVGWLVLAYALYRTQTLPTWVPVTLAVGVVAFGGIIPGVDALVIIGMSLLLIALGHLGVQAFQRQPPWSSAPEDAAATG